MQGQEPLRIPGRIILVDAVLVGLDGDETVTRQADEGPCLDCHRTGQPVVNEDLAAAAGERWPSFAREALAAGFHSVDALPLRLRGNVVGALNLFHRDPDAMTKEDIQSAQAFADIATIAILQQRAATEAQVLNQQLHQALNSRISRGIT